MISSNDRSVFEEQLRARRRRGPKKRVPERVPTSVKLPLPVFNALCHQANANRMSLHKFMLRALASAVSAELR